MAYKGKYRPKNLKKYQGNPDKITYRSLWERSMMRYLDENDLVIKWGSEEVVIPYISAVDGKRHKYYIDFHAEIKQPDGKVKKFLVEIKPWKQTQKPKEPKTKNYKARNRFLREQRTYLTNLSKWGAAKQLCENTDWEFTIITEKELYKKKKR